MTDADALITLKVAAPHNASLIGFDKVSWERRVTVKTASSSLLEVNAWSVIFNPLRSSWE